MQRTDFWISLAFLFMILSHGYLMTHYWQSALQPRLYREASAYAAILAQAQAQRLADAHATPTECCAELTETMDEILTFADPETEIPFFLRIALELDEEIVAAHTESFGLARGVEDCPACFMAEVPLFDRTSYELFGVARFWVSDRFFRQLSGDIRGNLIVQTIASMALLTVAWIGVLALFSRLRRQTSQRQEAEHALRHNRQRYQRLLDNLPNYFVYAREPDVGFTFVSDSVERVLGYAPDALMANFRGYLVDDPRNAGVNERLLDAAPADQPYEIVIRGRNGTVRNIECAETSLIDGRSSTLIVEGIARDITAQRSFESALKLAKEKAEAANEAKSQFLANVSHEVRTPMNAIIGLTALALKTDLTPKQQDYLTKIDYSAHALLEIIDDILDISKMEAGWMELESIDFELDDVLRRLTDNVALKVGEKGLEIAFSVAPNVPHKLMGDALRLGQVLLNLTNNAIKFTRQGEVLVGIREIKDRGHRVWLEFSVRDTGIGIEPEKISTLFDPFTQADGSNTRVYGGTGLGLAISKRLVELMKGTIRVESIPGRGSIFWFTAEFAKPEYAESNPWVVPDVLHGLRVLVVDDNLMARETLRNSLAVLSFDVEAADCGAAAVQALGEAHRIGRPFRLVLLDWVMPELDGIETARRIRGDARIREQPAILLVSAFSHEHPLQQAKDVEIDVLLAKPVSQSELFHAVLDALGHGDAEKVLGSGLPLIGRRVPSFARGTRLLVVEDSVINQQIARELLTDAGFEVSIAENGAQALKMLDRMRFSAVLMDVQMPVMDGFEATRRLRAQVRFADLPVIALTAHAMSGDVERCLGAGMSDYVSKPVDSDRLLRVLGRWIPQAQFGPVDCIAAPPAIHEPKWPGIDFRKALGLASGNRGLVEQLIRQFVDDNVETAGRIETALREGEKDQVEMLVHTLKGDAGAVGAEGVARAALELERAMRSGSSSSQALADLRKALERVVQGCAGEGAGSATQSGASGTDEADLSRATPLLRRLEASLAENNMAAGGFFRELCAMDGMQGLDEELAAIQAAMDRLDFEQALHRTQALAQNLSVELRP